GKARGASKPSYLLGVLTGFRRKLAAEKNVGGLAAPESKALIAAGDAELEAFIESRYPRVKSRRYTTTIRDTSSYFAGLDEGARLTLHKPVGSTDGNKGRVLVGGPGSS